jgi:predicted permease
MVSNLVFALNATIPLFIMIALGYFLKRVNILTDGFLAAANKFNFTITLPVLLFTDLASKNFRDTFDLKFVLFCAGSTTIGFFGAWILTKLFMKDKNSVGEFVQACYRSSTAVLGLALIQNIYGTTGMAGMMVLGAVPLYNVYAVIVLQTESPINKKGEKNIQRALKGIITNPILIGVILGLVASLINIKFPTIIDTSLNYVARIATPLAVICIGGEFSFKNAFKSLKKSSLAAAVKIILLPLVFVPIAILMGFYTDKLVAILVMLAGPTTPSCFIMAKQYGYEGTITSSAVVLTTLFSSVTLTLFIMILRSMGYI